MKDKITKNHENLLTEKGQNAIKRDALRKLEQSAGQTIKSAISCPFDDLSNLFRDVYLSESETKEVQSTIKECRIDADRFHRFCLDMSIDIPCTINCSWTKNCSHPNFKS